jgi:hypothetical protein
MHFYDAVFQAMPTAGHMKSSEALSACCAPAGSCWVARDPASSCLCNQRTAAILAYKDSHVDSHTFSSMDSESLKSLSIASTSASLGVLFRNRPKVRCARCILQGSRNYSTYSGSLGKGLIL